MTSAGRRGERGPIRLGWRDRAVAWFATGPLGRLYAFVADLAAAWWRWAWRR